MFRENQAHRQPPLFSSVQDLPPKLRQRLEQSWAGTFYRECFCRIAEETFAVLYATCPSRPNVAVNVLVGLEILKAGFGWSDEELYDAFSYDLQVRYALGYHQLGEGDFDLRTLYHFRQRLRQYQQQTQINLFERLFVALTDQQLAAFRLRTGQQRLDSTQIASHIADLSRLQLAVEAVRRLQRLLNEVEQARYAALLAPYRSGTAGQYAYRVKGAEATRHHLQQVGGVLAQLLREMAALHGLKPVYQTVQRFFDENYRLDAEAVVVRPNDELGSGSLQSLDDTEATYRQKGAEAYKGYVAHLAETCDPHNDLQLITQVAVAPNNVQDAQLLCAGLPSLQARTGVHTLYTDGGYVGPQVDDLLQAAQVTQIQTGLRGRRPDPQRLTLADFPITLDAAGVPHTIRCPGGQTVTVGRSRTGRYTAVWDPVRCAACTLYQGERCAGRLGQRDVPYHLSFDHHDWQRAQRKRRYEAERQAERHLRPAVEATMRSLKHPFRGQLPVRGRFRVTCLIVASAAMVNLRRIARYQGARAGAGPVQRVAQAATQERFFFVAARQALDALLGWRQPLATADFGC
jgi:hypothetical protein